MPGSSACAGVGVPGGRQARTVLSASDRAWPAPLPARRVHTAGPERPCGPGRFRCAVPGPPAGGTPPYPARPRHRAGHAATRHDDAAPCHRTHEQLLKPRRIVPQRPGSGPPAQRRLHPALVARHRLITDLHRPCRAISGAELQPLPGYPGEREHGNNFVAEQRLGRSSRSGPLSTPHSSTAAISLAVTRSHLRHVHSSSATSEPGKVPPRSPRSRLTASPWRVLDPHPHGDWTRARTSSEWRAAASLPSPDRRSFRSASP